jgi:predicted aspartyl protease
MNALLVVSSLALSCCSPGQQSDEGPQQIDSRATLGLTEYQCRQGLDWACRILPAARYAASVPEPPPQPLAEDDTPRCDYSSERQVCNSAGNRVKDTSTNPHDTESTSPQEEPSNSAAAADESPQSEPAGATLHQSGGTFGVPVSINGRLTLDFVVDSGASVVTIPADVVLTLIRTGTIRRDDFLGTQTYTLANGSTMPSEMFMIRELSVAGHDVLNVRASVAPVAGTPLLGQSFLGRFRSWSIDNRRRVLVLK